MTDKIPQDRVLIFDTTCATANNPPAHHDP